MRASLLRVMVLVATLATLSAPALAAPEIVQAIEYYHAGLDHYFVTASASEIAALDNGVFKGWARTGNWFGVYLPGTNAAGTTPVCRFYGNPVYGLDSHFYSASPAECAAVQQKWPEQWLLESLDVFQTVLPEIDTGICRSGTEPLYRMFNQRTDVNHRYLTNYGEMQATLDRGYAMEGYGTPPVAMCVPYPPVQTSVPVCEIDAQVSAPVATDVDRLTAQCTNHPKSFRWTNCSGNGGVCYTTRATPGPVTYSVVAINEAGTSTPATRTLDWTARPPRCAIAITTTAPLVGVPQTLYQSCDGQPNAFLWTNCESKGDTCIATASSPGPQTYTLYAANIWGTGEPYAQTLSWQQVTPICNVSSSFVNESTATLSAHCDGNPTSYVWTNCASTAASCTASSTPIGPITYTVRGVNAFGAGDPASVTVDWPGAKPFCTVTASSLTPMTGTVLTLTANCTNNPTSYYFANCPTQIGNTCQYVFEGTGLLGYIVIAYNAAGASNALTVDVTWQWGPRPPKCELTYGGSPPKVGTEITLYPGCIGNPSSFAWVNCASTTGTCVATSAVAGLVSYTVFATNAYGTSQGATVQLNWVP
ncbi:MAG: hypothetical protein ABI624_08575 [Casimicrobiaceae bacterium]